MIKSRRILRNHSRRVNIRSRIRQHKNISSLCSHTLSVELLLFTFYSNILAFILLFFSLFTGVLYKSRVVIHSLHANATLNEIAWASGRDYVGTIRVSVLSVQCDACEYNFTGRLSSMLTGWLAVGCPWRVRIFSLEYQRMELVYNYVVSITYTPATFVFTSAWRWR